MYSLRGATKKMARNKTNINRLEELEKIAEKLGIGQNRKVKCVGCDKTIKFRNTIILTNKKKVTYLCKDCYKKLEGGELNKKKVETDDILKEIERFRKEPAVQPVPYKPEPIDWNPPYQPTIIDEKPYYISTTKGSEFLKLEPNYDHETVSTTSR